MQESALHYQLKNRYIDKDAIAEVTVDGYKIDVVCKNLLIEIQTRNFSNVKSKIISLLDNHYIRLVHPIPVEKWIIRLNPNNSKPISRRKSPKHGRFVDLFHELVYLSHLPTHPNFSLEILLTHEEEYRINDGRGSWRRKGWSIVERHLIEVTSSKLFSCPEDYLVFLQVFQKQQTFTTANAAESLDIPLRLSQRMVYCLNAMSLIHLVGKDGRAYLYMKS